MFHDVLLCFYSILSVCSYLSYVEFSACPFYCGIWVTQKTNFHFMHLLWIIKFFCIGIHVSLIYHSYTISHFQMTKAEMLNTDNFLLIDPHEAYSLAVNFRAEYVFPPKDLQLIVISLWALLISFVFILIFKNVIGFAKNMNWAILWHAIWNKTRPRASVQNQQTRQLISTWKIAFECWLAPLFVVAHQTGLKLAWGLFGWHYIFIYIHNNDNKR